jgi:paraquat-inducible protein A
MTSFSFDATAASRTASWTCRWCGQEHASVRLVPGQRAACVRCGGMLARRGRLGPDAPLAFGLAGLFLALPALFLPFVTVAQFGSARISLVNTGAVALWDGGMRMLAIWTVVCGTLAPLLLFATLATSFAWRKGFPPPHRRRLHRMAHALEHWAMPEVHVLAVLVAVTKLGALVDVSIGPGFWCYAAMSVALLMAWRSFEYEPARPVVAAAGRVGS